MSTFPTLADALKGHREDYEARIPTCECGWEQGDDSGVGPFWRDHADDVWLDAREIHTPEQLAELPATVVIKTSGGSIACRHFDMEHGVVFGDDRPFAWTVLAQELPGVVLWHPDWSKS